MGTRLKSAAAILAIGLAGAFAAGCGESDSTSGDGVSSTPDSAGDPAATVPTTGSEDTSTSESGALGGAGPTGGQSAPESGPGAITQPDSSTGGSTSGGY